MDQTRFSTIAHHHHDHCNPVGAARLDAACERLELSPGRRVIDVGCGKAELLVRLAARYGAQGIGLDVNASFLAEGGERAARRGVGNAVTLLEMDAARFGAEPGSFDAAICIGASHALGDYRDTARTLAGWVRPGGRLLFGEGYWRREPEPEYLAFLGATRADYGGHEDNLETGRQAGLTSLDAWESTLEDWDDYEDLYAATAVAYATEHPDDPDASTILARIRGWREAYIRWGRDTLGFGLYLFER